MTDDFYSLLNEYVGKATDVADIRLTVRRCWFYDFKDYPVRVWQGKGRLITSDGNKWLGTIDNGDVDHHETPSLSDARDMSSATYEFKLPIYGYPGKTASELYDEIKAEQWRVNKRKLTCYLALFQRDEGLRPETPIVFFKELQMFSPKFSEKIEVGAGGVLNRIYNASIVAKDGNYGRSNVPGGTYADTVQKERAKQLGVTTDRGSEFLALLANRTYQLP